MTGQAENKDKKSWSDFVSTFPSGWLFGRGRLEWPMIDENLKSDKNMSYQENCQSLIRSLRRLRVVPVLLPHDLDLGLKLCETLLDCGLPAAEITFRSSVAETLLRAAATRFPELCLGAGTILNQTDLQRAFEAGAAFAVAPGLNTKVLQYAVDKALPFAPGVCTPSELELACQAGCRLLKFYPAEACGGLPMLKALIAPYAHLGLHFMPTGGIDGGNLAAYLSLKEVAAVGGTWLGKTADLEEGNWNKIRLGVRETLDTIRQTQKTV